MNKIKASIVIRTKNEERWIPYCLEAVLSQEKISKEIIVIDDNSVDKTLEIVEKFPVKLFFYKGEYLPKINFGVCKCSREFVVFIWSLCSKKS